MPLSCARDYSPVNVVSTSQIMSLAYAFMRFLLAYISLLVCTWVLRASETLRGRDKLSGLYRVLFMSGLNPQTHKSKTLLCGLVIVDPFHIQSPKGFRGD